MQFAVNRERRGINRPIADYDFARVINTNEVFILSKKYVELRKRGKNNRSSTQYIGVSEATGGRVWKL